MSNITNIHSSFNHKKYQFLADYEQFFQSKVVIDGKSNVLSLDRSLYEQSLPGSFPVLHQQAKWLIETQVSDSPLQEGVGHEISRILMQNGECLSISLEEMSKLLKMSPRTLQRRLIDEKITFLDLKSRVRFQLASQAIKAGEQNIEEISEKLGFSDRHSFTRAFKRWSGMSPRAYREHLKNS